MPRTYVKNGQVPRYSNEDFQLALKEISEGSDIRATAKKYNISKSTLHLHHSSQASHGVGRATHFTELEEIYLVSAATVLQISL
ncbi:unnamed protein product [Didymodactylos carnosus]|uniref:HTH psq-type domain-containing protein n=1 Tax=Didymodactylos carnosus TaxID=1234261 RepID=A0A815BXB9_9BILA|nr:unnamed protein product [Didymodactylos carnosus]CAF1278991.1 unnamed protein product [Didymodactylos carnosus]CAF3761354.1 unnamed protein product [Didymodactylos carnosus]CAF4072666.1 unnamed protein product [Didymodactylos carnosus]